jgi:hypothetical protein
MTSPFTEAHQFKGIPIDKKLMDAADALETAGGEQPATSIAVAGLRARAKPPATHHFSMKFSNGKMFDVQEDHTGQYLVLDPTEDKRRARCDVGEWIVLMPSGQFKVFSNEDYLAFGGTPETEAVTVE